MQQPVECLGTLSGGRVIVMDDEEIIRKTVARMIESLGFVVIAAKDGAEVISLLEKAVAESSPIDVQLLI